jgi:hypothetical protein
MEDKLARRKVEKRRSRRCEELEMVPVEKSMTLPTHTQDWQGVRHDFGEMTRLWSRRKATRLSVACMQSPGEVAMRKMSS